MPNCSLKLRRLALHAAAAAAFRAPRAPDPQLATAAQEMRRKAPDDGKRDAKKQKKANPAEEEEEEVREVTRSHFKCPHTSPCSHPPSPPTPFQSDDFARFDYDAAQNLLAGAGGASAAP